MLTRDAVLVEPVLPAPQPPCAQHPCRSISKHAAAHSTLPLPGHSSIKVFTPVLHTLASRLDQAWNLEVAPAPASTAASTGAGLTARLPSNKANTQVGYKPNGEGQCTSGGHSSATASSLYFPSLFHFNLLQGHLQRPALGQHSRPEKQAGLGFLSISYAVPGALLWSLSSCWAKAPGGLLHFGGCARPWLCCKACGPREGGPPAGSAALPAGSFAMLRSMRTEGLGDRCCADCPAAHRTGGNLPCGPGPLKGSSPTIHSHRRLAGGNTTDRRERLSWGPTPAPSRGLGGTPAALFRCRIKSQAGDQQPLGVAPIQGC